MVIDENRGAVGALAPPVSAVEIRISIGAVSMDRAISVLREITMNARERDEITPMASGGGGQNSSVTVARRDVTEEQYNAELQAWCERDREARRPTP